MLAKIPSGHYSFQSFIAQNLGSSQTGISHYYCSDVHHECPARPGRRAPAIPAVTRHLSAGGRETAALGVWWPSVHVVVICACWASWIFACYTNARPPLKIHGDSEFV